MTIASNAGGFGALPARDWRSIDSSSAWKASSNSSCRVSRKKRKELARAREPLHQELLLLRVLALRVPAFHLYQSPPPPTRPRPADSVQRDPRGITAGHLGSRRVTPQKRPLFVGSGGGRNAKDSGLMA